MYIQRANLAIRDCIVPFFYLFSAFNINTETRSNRGTISDATAETREKSVNEIPFTAIVPLVRAISLQPRDLKRSWRVAGYSEQLSYGNGRGWSPESHADLFHGILRLLWEGILTRRPIDAAHARIGEPREKRRKQRTHAAWSGKNAPWRIARGMHVNTHTHQGYIYVHTFTQRVGHKSVSHDTRSFTRDGIFSFFYWFVVNESIEVW